MYISGMQTSNPGTPYSSGNRNPVGKTSFAKMLHREQSALEQVNSEDAIPAPEASGGLIALEFLELTAYEDLKDFNTRFQTILTQCGIDTAQKIELDHEYASGKVIVKNDHPDKEKIETLFEENLSLRNGFTNITSTVNFLEGARRALEFKRAYATDREQAVEDFQYLRHTHTDVSISFENGDYEVSAENVQNSLPAKFTPFS